MKYSTSFSVNLVFLICLGWVISYWVWYCTNFHQLSEQASVFLVFLGLVFCLGVYIIPFFIKKLLED